LESPACATHVRRGVEKRARAPRQGRPEPADGRDALLLRHATIAALLLAPVAAAAAGALPEREPGLWETRAVIDGRLRTMRRCFVADEPSSFIETAGVESCTRHVFRTPPGFVMRADCRLRGMILTGRLQVVGDFSTQLRGAVKSWVRRETEDTPWSRTAMTFTSRRLGACAAGPR
jgi:hypothetical protein